MAIVAITINGKPLHWMSNADILNELAKETEAELSDKEEKQVDQGTD